MGTGQRMIFFSYDTLVIYKIHEEEKHLEGASFSLDATRGIHVGAGFCGRTKSFHLAESAPAVLHQTD